MGDGPQLPVRGAAGPPAVVRLEGSTTDIEFVGNRLFRLENGFAFGLLGSNTTRPQVTQNTIYDVTAGLHFEVAGGETGKYAVGVTKNYFARTENLARRTDGGGPIPGVTSAENAHDKHSKDGNAPLTATRLDSPELPPPNPDDDATFLRFPADGPKVGAQ